MPLARARRGCRILGLRNTPSHPTPPHREQDGPSLPVNGTAPAVPPEWVTGAGESKDDPATDGGAPSPPKDTAGPYPGLILLLNKTNPEPSFLKEIPMSSTKTSPNGQERKTLASQLDRLDQILDTLGEGLNEAVAQAVQEAVETAVREGVHQGVRGALSEVLTNPEVLA